MKPTVIAHIYIRTPNLIIKPNLNKLALRAPWLSNPGPPKCFTELSQFTAEGATTFPES